MIKLSDKKTIYYDVDDTLVLWHCWQGREKECVVFEDKMYNCNNVVPHYQHVNSLMNHKKNGHNIVVWSQGGSDWAEAVIKALKLEKYVDAVMCKPDCYYDDLHCADFMTVRHYIKPSNGIT